MKPCKCGGTVAIVHDYGSEDGDSIIIPSVRLWCEGCGKKTKQFQYLFDRCSAEKRAIKEWVNIYGDL